VQTSENCAPSTTTFSAPSLVTQAGLDFVSQADTKDLALFVHECLDYCAQVLEHHLACLSMVLVAGLFGLS